MFSFHKPRVYRSSEGCCICRAKTSSSRFIESKKYERDAMKCFLLEEPRKGEICNACVLLVKRYKRLPAGSNKNWGHVVDARCGSSTKSQKSGPSNTTSVKSSNGGNTGSSSSSNSHHSTSTSRSILPEKFAKIFKKTKKSKNPKKCVELQPSSKRKTVNGNGYDMSMNGGGINGSQQLSSTTPDSVDSDCEQDSHYAAGPTNGTHVEFQTQTRASSYRTRKSSSLSAVVKCENGLNGGRRRSVIKLGSKRRKCFMPHKRRLLNYTDAEEKMEFFDTNEWQKRKTCCGFVYACSALDNAVLIQNSEYQPCEEHLKKRQQIVSAQQQKPLATLPAVVQISTASATAAVVNVTPPCTNNSSSSNTNSNIVTNFKSTNSTPVLKKHHLFFKRQSESFPHGDISAFHAKTDQQQQLQPASVAITPLQQNQITITPTATNLPTANSSSSIAISSASSSSYTAPAPPPPSQNTISHHHQHLVMSSAAVISTTHTPPTTTTPISYIPRHSSAKITTIATPMSSSSSAAISALPMHTTATPTNSSSSSAPIAMSSKSQHFLHKIKATDSGGKIVKQQQQHSMDNKLQNTTVRIKTSDLHDMKHVIKTVDKSYVLAKPTTITPINCTTTSQLQQHQQQQQYHHHHSLAQTLHNSTTIAAGAASPSSSSTSSTSSSSTKFSDNSSDSGFDENMLDRKSASPLQEDTDRKIMARPGVQTMFLSSGVQIQGQHQNLVLTGNEVAAKLMQNRRSTAVNNNNHSNATITVQPINNTTITPTTPATAAAMMHHHQQYANNNRVTASSITLHSNNPSSTSSSSSTVKIAQIIGNGAAAVTGINNSNLPTNGGSHVAKMRAIYNNNTIQHENGVTTIVPASSLMATTQTAAMNAIAPSTVTITPAPIHQQQGGSAVSAMKKKSNVLSNKPSVVNNNTNDYQNQNMQNLLVGNNLSMYSTQQQQQHSLQQQHHNQHHLHQQQQQQQHPNQKIILLKTPPNMAAPPSASSSSTITSKYVNSVATQNLINKAFLNATTTMTQNIATSLPPSTNIIKTRP